MKCVRTKGVVGVAENPARMTPVTFLFVTCDLSNKHISCDPLESDDEEEAEEKKRHDETKKRELKEQIKAR